MTKIGQWELGREQQRKNTTRGKKETYTLDIFSYFFVSALLWEEEAT